MERNQYDFVRLRLEAKAEMDMAQIQSLASAGLPDSRLAESLRRHRANLLSEISNLDLNWSTMTLKPRWRKWDF